METVLILHSLYQGRSVTVNVKNGEENGSNGEKTQKLTYYDVEGQIKSISHNRNILSHRWGQQIYSGTDELLGSEMIKDGASGRDGKKVLNGKVDPRGQGKDGRHIQKYK